MNKLTQAQTKEFWEGYGVEPHPIYPTGVDYLDIDLGNLFEYAVPKAITILIVANGIDEYEAIEIIFARWLEKFREGYSFSDALFWVLDKVRR